MRQNEKRSKSGSKGSDLLRVSAGVMEGVEHSMNCWEGLYFSPAKTTPRKPKNLREICGTNPCALLCSPVRNEYNGRYATISINSAI